MDAEAGWKDVFTVQGVLLLVLMPFLDELKMAWVYTAVPLYWIDNGWSLLSLGLVLGCAYLPRMVMTACIHRFGDFLIVPVGILGAFASVPVLIYPTSMVALVIGLYGCSMTVTTQAYRSLANVVYGHDDPLLQKAMRVFTFADVLGYSFGPAIGGVLFDNTGYFGCVLFQMAALGSQSFLCACMPAIWASAPGVCLRWQRKKMATSASQSAPPNSDGDVAVPQEAPRDASTTLAVKEAIVWRPLFWVHSMYFTNLFVYVVEWNLYALYFKQVHDWSGTWMGVAQMSGDLFGGLTLLFLTTHHCKAALSAWAKRHSCIANLLGPPYCNVVLLLIHGALLVLLARPEFALSLIGQVGMGTTCILNEQVLQEMIARYCTGNRALYRTNMLIQYLIFCFSFLVAGFASAPLYDSFGATVPFHACTVLAFLNALAFGGFFVQRLASTTSGLFGGFDAAEKELLALEHASSARSSGSDSSASGDAGKQEQIDVAPGDGGG